MIDRVAATVTTAGSAGNATGKATLKTPGGPSKLLGIRLDYTGEPGTTIVTVSDRGSLNGTVLTRSATATDGTFRPQAPAHDASGAAIEKGFVPFVVDGLTVDVTKGDNGGTVKVEAYFEN